MLGSGLVQALPSGIPSTKSILNPLKKGEKKGCPFSGQPFFVWRWVANGIRTHDPQNHNLML